MAEYNANHFRFIKSCRGGNKLEESGFLYDKHKIVGEVTHWQCERRSDCKARIHTQNMQIIKRTNDHLHGPDMNKVYCLEAKAGIKRKAEETQDSSHHIVCDGVLHLSSEASSNLPKITSLKRTIQRSRSNTHSVPVQPSNLTELVIPLDYQKTSKNETFLLFDSGPEHQRILIFGTNTNAEMLNYAQIWLADGTFKTAPILFEQIYVIHALRGGPEPITNGHLLPSLFILLTSKSQNIYMKMWEAVKQIVPDSQPTHMLMDFEKAAISSFNHFWPQTIVKGFFHFTQNIFRKIQGEGLQNEYQQNKNFALKIKLLPALSFAPPNDVLAIFPDVVGNLPMPVSEGLILYFERTYIGRFLLGGTYQHPLFPIEMWNYHNEVITGFPLTNNSVKAWHRSFAATVGCYHPTIWKFIQALQKEQGLVELKQSRYISGDRPTKRIKWHSQEEWLKNLVLDYSNRPIIEFYAE